MWYPYLRWPSDEKYRAPDLENAMFAAPTLHLEFVRIEFKRGIKSKLLRRHHGVADKDIDERFRTHFRTLRRGEISKSATGRQPG